ncbi:MAG TPA: hypothetical protein VGM53_18595 [Streptosporangiaceae bacterium]
MRTPLSLRTAVAGGLATAAALAPAAARHPASTRGGTSTLTIKGTNMAGQPDTGDAVFVANADQASRFNGPYSVAPFTNGVARLRNLPDGHYWALGLFNGKNGSTERLPVLPQFTVSGDTTVHISARAATSRVTVVPPRPASLVYSTLAVVRYSATGPPSSQGVTVESGPSAMYVSPVTKLPTVGSIRMVTSQMFGSPGGSRNPYQYLLEYGSPKGTIPVREHYVVRRSDLATVSEVFYRSAPKITWSPGTMQPALNAGGGPWNFTIHTPGSDLVYFGGNLPGFYLRGQYWPGGGLQSGPGQLGAGNYVPPGRRVTSTWNRYPLHPDANALFTKRIWYQAVQPSASRAGNTLRLDVTPFTDNKPGDTGSGYGSYTDSAVTGTYQLDANGKKIAGGNAVTAANSGTDLNLTEPLPSGSSDITFRLTASRSGRGIPLPTSSDTVWTWRSASGPGSRLPSSWYCWADTAGTGHTCTVQPMMTLEYNVSHLGLNESAPPGRQAVTVTAGHLQLARSARVTGASVSVSFDRGKTWHKTAITPLGHGRFRAAFSAPANATVALRTKAADAAGGSISETITGAYKTS